MLKKVLVGGCALMLVAGMFPTQITWAAYNFPSVIGQITGDCTTAGANSYVTTCTKTNGTAFGTAATVNTGTTGSTIPLLSGANTWGAAQTFAGVSATSVASSGAVSGTSITGTSLSAGSGAVSAGSASITGALTSAAQVTGFRNFTGSGSVTLTATDYLVCINKTTGSATAVAGPATPVTGQIYVLKDCKGDAATNNITFTPASGNVDGAATLVLNQAYQAINLVYNGTQFNAF